MILRGRYLASLIVLWAVSSVATAQAQDGAPLSEVASQVPLAKLPEPPPSFGAAPVAFRVRESALVEVPFDHPALEGVDPATASFAELRDGKGWALVTTKRDPDGGHLLAELEAGAVYGIVGASRFGTVREQQARLCREGGGSPRQVDRICTQILCPADAMAALDSLTGDFGASDIAMLPGAGSAANLCERCTQPGGFGGAPLECEIDGGSIWTGPTLEPSRPLIPYWPLWPVWQSAKTSNFCTPGIHRVGVARYDLPDALPLPTPFGATDVRAEVRYPARSYGVNATPVSGRFPLAVFLHGNHCVCADGCVNHNSCSAADRIPNHRGYDYIMDVLASRGYVAVSIDGYDVTAKNSGPTMSDYEARARLILDHLDRLRGWSQSGGGPVDTVARAIDFDEIALIGHSRGGEGVVAADVVNDVDGLGFNIEAIVAIAPTDQDPFVDWTPLNPYLVILANNDGDVTTLHGQRTYDRAFPASARDRAEKTMLWVFGANHNFFNTTWTPGSGDPFASDDGIGIGRMTAPAQRRIGCEVISAFLDKELRGDTLAAKTIRGEHPFGGMGGVEHHRAHARADALLVDDFEHGNGPTVNALGGPVTTTGSLPLFALVPFTQSGPHPSFRGETNGLVIGANGTASYETELPANRRDVRRYRELSMRIAQLRQNASQPPLEEPADLMVTLVDGAGNEANQRFDVTQTSTVTYPAAGGSSPTILTTVRLRLADFKRDNTRFDFSDLAKIRLKLTGDARFAIDDIALANRGRTLLPWADLVVSEVAKRGFEGAAR